MKLTAQIRYAADPAAVFAMLTDPTFQAEVCQATGALSHSVDVQESDGGATVTTAREMPTDQFPDFVKRLVGDTVQVVRVDRWAAAAGDGGRAGTVVVEIKGAPVRLSGTLRLTGDGAATVEDVDGDLKASVPLMGGKIEKAVEPPLRAAVAKEGEIGARWLSR